MIMEAEVTQLHFLQASVALVSSLIALYRHRVTSARNNARHMKTRQTVSNIFNLVDVFSAAIKHLVCVCTRTLYII